MVSERIDLFLADEAATSRLADDLALALKSGDCLALSGELGAGKSTLARAIIRAIANEAGLEVPSPTFTLMQSYDLRIPISHFDLYRIASPEELDELGLDEALSSGIVLIEWPERAMDYLPKDRITITLTGSGESRNAVVSGPEDFIARFERSLAGRAFLSRNGHAKSRRRFLKGDASTRRYETIGEGAIILMDAPPRHDGPPVRDGLPYSRIAKLAEDVTPFVAVDQFLLSRGFSAPAIPAADFEAGFLLVENLGLETMLSDGAPDRERYMSAIQCLSLLHASDVVRELPLPDGRIYHVPTYDRRAMQIEVELLTDWYLPWHTGEPVGQEQREHYLELWQDLFERLEKAETSLVLRDYHSPNLIWLPEREGPKRIGMIDFQDAVIGPSAYDVASLVQDARVDVTKTLTTELLAAYESFRASHGGFDPAAFRQAYAIMCAQRASKLFGIFVRLDQRDAKPDYLQHLPRIKSYLTTALDHEALHPLRSWFLDAGIIEAGS